MVAMLLLLVHLGYKAEKDPSVLNKQASNREEAIILDTLKSILVEEPGKWHTCSKRS